MIDASSSIVQVVTAGTDWAAIVAAIVTAVAAVAGIWGTAWQAKRGRAAASADLDKSLNKTTENLRLTFSVENDQAKIAEKRRIYAQCQAAFSALIQAAVRQRIATDQVATAIARNYDDSTFNFVSLTKEKADGESVDAQRIMLRAVSELYLIGPNKVRELTAEVANALGEYMTTLTKGEEDTRPSLDKISDILRCLYEVMRADLGEKEEQAPLI